MEIGSVSVDGTVQFSHSRHVVCFHTQTIHAHAHAIQTGVGL